jgi:MFS transporter, ACS family, tartrate transporter
MQTSLEQRVLAKVSWRLMPLLCLCFLAAFLDRVNVSFAKLTMLADLGFSQAVYATGAGIFFIGYFLFEVPSNLLLERFGARLWIARIMCLWGLISSSMMFVSERWMFYTLRFLLGAAEAGFFPGVIFYLTYWFPRAYRARAVSSFMVAAVFSFVIGSPLSGWLMDHPQLGLTGWQWLFLVEGLPSVLLAFVVLWYLPNGPKDARWLEPAEQSWLLGRLGSERAEQERRERLTLAQALRDRRVLLFSSIYFTSVVGGYGFEFFAPTLLQRAYPELSTSELGWVAAIAPLVTIPIMIAHGRSADKRQEQRLHVVAAALCFALGLGLLSLDLPSVFVVPAMTLCVAGRWCIIGPFWGMPTSILTGTAAAGGIALINALGNLGGQAGPLILGWSVSASGDYSRGLLVLAGLVLSCAGLTLFAPTPKARAAPVVAAAASE